MASADIARLSARLPTDYNLGYHRQYLLGDLVAMAGVAQDALNAAASAAAAQAAIAAIYQLALALGASAYGVGSDVAALPRNLDLGTAAYADLNGILGHIPSLQNAAYQMTVHDRQRLTYTTSGTNTWTLPLAADLPEGWRAPFWNTSGANLTLAREASLADTINGSAASLTVATGATTRWIWRVSATAFLAG